MSARTATAMSEEQMVHLVRNALLVAGQEMGKGDQWPVIKDAVYKIMKDWEDLRVERNVDEELKVHLYAQLTEMEAGLTQCTDEQRIYLEPKIKELREVCDAYFSEINEDAIVRDAETAPLHIQRIKTILSTMEEDNE